MNINLGFLIRKISIESGDILTTDCVALNQKYIEFQINEGSNNSNIYDSVISLNRVITEELKNIPSELILLYQKIKRLIDTIDNTKEEVQIGVYFLYNDGDEESKTPDIAFTKVLNLTYRLSYNNNLTNIVENYISTETLDITI